MIPQFDGKKDPDAYVDLVFRTYPCEATRDQVHMVTCESTEYALQWWSHYTSVPIRANRIRSWDELKTVMRARYVPPNYNRDLRKLVQKLRQGRKSVDAYYRELECLLHRAEIHEDDDDTLLRFTGGLNEYILDKLDFQQYSTLEEAYHLATTIEEQIKRRFQAKPSYRYDKGIPQTLPSSNSKSFVDSRRAQTKEDKPSSSGSKKDKQVASQQHPNRTLVKCFKCNGDGHLQRDCPNNRRLLFNMNDTGEVVSENDEEEPKVVTDTSDDYSSFDAIDSTETQEILVIRKSLSLQEIECEDAQRTNIFHGRCIIKSKPCSFIINSGSCTNIVSSYLVEKLQLQTMKHPKPYALQWLRNGAELKVT